jgi:hypothetical protein
VGAAYVKIIWLGFLLRLTVAIIGFVHKKKPTYLERFIREESSQRAPPYFVDGGSSRWEYKLD